MPLLSSLKRALTFNFLLVAAVPVLFLGLLNIQLIFNYQLDGVRERNMMRAKSIAEEVKSFLDEVHVDLQLVQETIAADEVLRPASVDAYLAGAVKNSLIFESIYLIDADRKVLHSSIMDNRRAQSRLDHPEHRLFHVGGKIQEPTWSGTFLSTGTGEPSIAFGLPVPQGYLLADVRIRSLGRILQRSSLYGGVEASIIDSQGALIASNVSEMIDHNFADHPAFTLALEGQETTQEFIEGTKYYLESVAHIPSSEWVVWVGLNMSNMLAPIDNMRHLLIGVMIMAVLLGAIIAILNVRRLIQPLTVLGHRAGQIAGGHYEFALPPSGFSEIDTLANQITNMSHAIKIREESIITNEQRFRDLVNSIDGIVWEMEYPSFRFMFVSRQAENLLGYPLHDWYTDADFWKHKTHPEDIQRAEAYCRMMSEKHQDHDFEYRMFSAGGRIVWMHNLVTVVIENDRPVRLLGVMLDVTVQKELLNELSRSEQNYREIFNATSDAIFIHDAVSGHVIDVNQATLKMFKCTYEQALSGGIAQFSPGDDSSTKEKILLKFKEAQETGGASYEWRARKTNGDLFWADVKLRSAMVGNQQRILAAVRDISERRDAAEKIRAANERLTLLIDRMPLGCIFWAPDFTVNMWNPAAEAIFGFTEAEMLGKRPYNTIVPEMARWEVDPVWAQLKAGDNSAHGMNENVTKSGKLITCEWYNTPVHDLSGETIGVISMVQDISARKIAESELAKYRAQLEELVRERTEQLQAAQQELVQKERLAVLGQLTATVSHEIRNPLGTVANSIYLLKESLKGEEHIHLARPLKLAERNVERCDNIISELLDFSRQRMIEKEPLAIGRWLTELLGEISIPDEVQLHWELDLHTIVPVDSERLRRVMINVITNALQAFYEVSDRVKKLEIRSRKVDECYEITVSDNGPGMSKEILERIFEPMFSTKTFGVGLGVPIIKNVLEGHGGGVKYHSEVGKGTTVVMSLPLAETS